MPSFHIIKKHKYKDTFNTSSIKGKFDIQTDTIKEEFQGNIDIENIDWNIGIIVGNSGTGKTTIAKQLFKQEFIDFNYKEDSIIDDMPKDKSINEITQMFNSVGFSSPPSWLKPYSVLSNGEKMRTDLAYSLLLDKEMIIFDEFTSVVDRNIAKIGSLALQKTIRRNNKQFIAVSCHFDIIDWLEADWIFNTNDMNFKNTRGLLQRPKIELSIRKCTKELWRNFKKHHYLNNNLGKHSQNYCLLVNNNLAGFIGIVHFPHSKIKNFKRVHRLVILPDYQGIGLGKILLEEIGILYKNKEFRYIITTSQPGLIHYFNKSKNWILKNRGRHKGHGGQIMRGSLDRYTTSWEYKNNNHYIEGIK